MDKQQMNMTNKRGIERAHLDLLQKRIDRGLVHLLEEGAGLHKKMKMTGGLGRSAGACPPPRLAATSPVSVTENLDADGSSAEPEKKEHRMRRSSQREVPEPHPVGTVVYVAANTGCAKTIPMSVVSVRDDLGTYPQYNLEYAEANEDGSHTQFRSLRGHGQVSLTPEEEPPRDDDVVYVGEAGKEFLRLKSPAMKKIYNLIAQEQKVEEEEARRALKVLRQVHWELVLSDEMGTLVAIMWPLGPKPPGAEVPLKTNVVLTNNDDVPYPWEVAVVMHNGTPLTDEEKLDLKKGVAVWVIKGWAADGGHPMCAHVPDALTVSDIDELRTALSLDSIEEVYVWLQGCGASGRHDIDASRALLGSTVAKKCFFGPDWDNVELLSFGGLKPGNKSARAVYVRTDPDTGEQSQESYQCGGVIGRRTCDCATAEEQVALYALRNVAETVMRSVLPAGEHRERGLRPWSRFAVNIIQRNKRERRPHANHTDTPFPDEPAWASIFYMTGPNGVLYAGGELLLSEVGIRLPAQPRTLNLIDGAKQHAVLPLRRAKNTPSGVEPTRVSVVCFVAPAKNGETEAQMRKKFPPLLPDYEWEQGVWPFYR